MGMGDAGMIITSDYGSFPHSLLSTSKKMDYYSYKIMISFFYHYHYHYYYRYYYQLLLSVVLLF